MNLKLMYILIIPMKTILKIYFPVFLSFRLSCNNPVKYLPGSLRKSGIVLLLLTCCSIRSFSRDTNIENWTFLGGITHLGKTELSFHSANFFRHRIDGYFLNHTQISLHFPSKSNWSAGIAYKQEYVKFPDRWRTEYRPMLHLFYKINVRYLNISDRSRWEFRIMDGGLINRYRNQIQLAYTKSKKLTPYISTESSFYFNPLNYTRQRTIIGAEIPLKNFELNLFAGHQLNEDLPKVWNTTFMIGTGLMVHF